MKTTQKQPVKIALAYPDGTRIEARIPLWKAYAIMSDLEREKAIKKSLLAPSTDKGNKHERS